MVVRKAETRDLPAIITQFLLYINYIRKVSGENCLFTEDPNTLVGGVITTLAYYLNGAGNSILLVAVEDDAVKGFMAGRVEVFPPFCVHTKVGHIMYMHPLSFQTSPKLRDVFDEWAKANGCTARMASTDIGNEVSKKFLKRNKMAMVGCHFMKGY